MIYYYDYIEVFSENVELHKNILDNDIYLLYDNNNNINIIDINDLPLDYMYDRLYNNHNIIPRTCVTNHCSWTGILYPFLPIYYYEELMINRLYNINVNIQNICNMDETFCVTKLKKENGKYKLIYYVNQLYLNDFKNKHYKKSLQKLLFIKSKINNEKIFSNTCTRILQIIPPIIPHNIQHNIQYNDILNDNIVLYNYQVNDILWMKEIEKSVDLKLNKISVEYNPCETFKFDSKNTIIGNIDKFPINEIVIYKNDIVNNYEHINTTIPYELEYYGGNIISTMGLGKTLIILTHILSKKNKYDVYVEFEPDYCNYFYKRGKNTGQTCIKKKHKSSELYCKEHSNTIFIDKRNILIKGTKDQIIQFDKNQMIKTNSNIIFCPKQLCDQWLKEYYQKFKINKIILLIITFDQYKNLTISDIILSDLIIISFEFLLNYNYNKTKKEIFKNLDDKYINLSKFHFNSVYIDEYTEIDYKIKFQSEMKTIKSNYRWNISGTPFANKHLSFVNGLNYISNHDYVFYHSSPPIIENLHIKLIDNCSMLYRRNTTESIKDEYVMNIINEKCILLDFTQNERNIYNSYNLIKKRNENFLIKLCCDPAINNEIKDLIKNCKTLNEIESTLLNHNKQKLDLIQIKINNLTDELTTLEKNYATMSIIMFENIDDDFEKKLKISTCKRNLTNEKKHFDNINSIYTYLKNVISNMNETEMCPICLDDIQDIAITSCGHKFCWDCISEFSKNIPNLKCPKCNVPINSSDIYLIKEQQEAICDNSLSDLINELKSTKLGNIIYYLSNEFKNGNQNSSKCIVFSQFTELIDKIQSILIKKLPMIKFVQCKGSVYQRKTAIDKFKNDTTCNIIFLSSENSASGINLTCANKILLIEPVYGEYEYRKDIESQSIGRAVRIGNKQPIHVIRFIIKDTIEEEIYNENKLTF